MRILVTGSRYHSGVKMIREAIRNEVTGLLSKNVTIVSGNCPTGVDKFAEELARDYGYNLELHPADWNTHGKKAGPLRNQAMVDLGADVVLAFPEGESRGTRHCIRAAKKAGLKVKIF